MVYLCVIILQLLFYIMPISTLKKSSIALAPSNAEFQPPQRATSVALSTEEHVHRLSGSSAVQLKKQFATAIHFGAPAESIVATPKYVPPTRTVEHTKEPNGGYQRGSPLYDKPAGYEPTDEPVGEETAAPATGTRSRNVPLFIFVLILAVVVLLLCGYFLYSRMHPIEANAPKVPTSSAEQSILMSEILPQSLHRWAVRGTLRGIAVHVFGLSGLAVNALALLVVYKAEGVRIDCEPGGRYHMRWWEAEFCNYTSAYILTFPQLAMVVACLLIGRDILQHRFYYALLGQGGVLDYHQSSAFKDPLFLMCLWYYAHVLMYLAFVTSLISWDKAIDEGSGSHVHYWNLLEELVLLVLVPCTLFMYLFFSKYSLETSLVPLSEFTTNAETGHAELAKIRVVEESAAREIIAAQKQNPASRLSEPLPDQTKFSIFVQLCTAGDPGFTARRPSHLFNYLWPSAVLLSRKTEGGNAKLFRALWCIFLFFTMLFIVLNFVILFHLCVWLFTRGRLVGCIVAGAQVVVTCIALGSFVNASRPLLK